MNKKWILCNDNIPDDMKIVLVTYKKYVNYEKTINPIIIKIIGITKITKFLM